MDIITKPVVNGLVFQVRTSPTSCIPVLMFVDSPFQATQLNISPHLYQSLGIDRVALVNVQPKDGLVHVEKLKEVSLFMNGDSTTAKKALDLIIRSGGLDSFITESMNLVG